MSYKLFLDDEREPPQDFVLARTIHEAIGIVEDRGLPETISFDYYLSNHHTGLDFAMWLIIHCEWNELSPDFKYKSHSADRSAREKIVTFLDEHVKKLKDESEKRKQKETK